MNYLYRLLLCLVIFSLFACATKVTVDNGGNKSAKNDKAESSQLAAEKAQAELDAAQNGDVKLNDKKPVTDKPKPTGGAKSDKANNAQQQQAKADEAQRELDCAISGDAACESVINELLKEEGQTYEEYIASLNKPRPGGSYKEGALKVERKNFPLKNGFPVWFEDPNLGGYIGGIGGAKPQKNGGLPAQRKVAMIQAQADLARSLRVNVFTETYSEKISTTYKGINSYQEKFETMSRQEVDEYIKKPHIMDEWVNVNTGELFIWVVLPK